MKKLSNTEAELKKKRCLSKERAYVLHIFSQYLLFNFWGALTIFL